MLCAGEAGFVTSRLCSLFGPDAWLLWLGLLNGRYEWWRYTPAARDGYNLALFHSGLSSFSSESKPNFPMATPPPHHTLQVTAVINRPCKPCRRRSSFMTSDSDTLAHTNRYLRIGCTNSVPTAVCQVRNTGVQRYSNLQIPSDCLPQDHVEKLPYHTLPYGLPTHCEERRVRDTRTLICSRTASLHLDTSRQVILRRKLRQMTAKPSARRTRPVHDAGSCRKFKPHILDGASLSPEHQTSSPPTVHTISHTLNIYSNVVH